MNPSSTQSLSTPEDEQEWDGKLPTSISLDVPHNVASHIAMPGGVPAKALRLTLANLGDLDGEKRAAVHNAVSRVAGAHWPTDVSLTGMSAHVAKELPADVTGQYMNSEDPNDGALPSYATVYATATHPALAAMYSRMGMELKDAGVEYSQSPSTPPAVSLGQVDIGAQPPEWANGPFPSWTAHHLTVHEGDTATDYPLTGTQRKEQPIANGEVWADPSPEAQRIVYGAVLIPDIPDAWGHSVSKPEIEKAAHRYVTNGGLMGEGPHTPEMRGKVRDDIELLESYIAPQDVTIGGKVVPQGSWVIAGRTPEDVWQKVLNREYQSFSLWGTGDIVDTPYIIDAPGAPANAVA